MAQAYLTDETRTRLDKLCEVEKRAIGDEIDFLVDRRFTELSLPDDSTHSGEENNHTKTQGNSQEKIA